MSWMKQSISLAILSFIAIAFFIVMSPTFETLLGYVESESSKRFEDGSENDSIVAVTNNVRTLFGLIFGLAIFSYILAVFLNSHEDEGEDYIQRRNR